MPDSIASRAASAALTRSSSALRKRSCSASCCAEATSLAPQLHSSAGQLGGTLPQFWMHQASSAAVWPTTAVHDSTPASAGSGEGSGEGAGSASSSALASFCAASCASRASLARCAADLTGADLWPLLAFEAVPASAIGGSSDAFVDEEVDALFLELFLARCVTGFLPLASATAEGLSFLEEAFSSFSSSSSSSSAAASRAACALVSSLSFSTL